MNSNDTRETMDMGKRGRRNETFLERLERCDQAIVALEPEDVPEMPTVEELSAFYESILTEDWIENAKNAALFFVATGLRDHEEIRVRTERLIELCADSETFDNYVTAEQLNRELDRYLEDWPVSFIIWCWEEYAEEGLINDLSWKPEDLAKMCRARIGRGEGDSAFLETVASALEKLQGVIEHLYEEGQVKVSAEAGQEGRATKPGRRG